MRTHHVPLAPPEGATHLLVLAAVAVVASVRGRGSRPADRIGLAIKRAKGRCKRKCKLKLPLVNYETII